MENSYYHETKTLRKLTIRLSKKDSSMLYFIMESNENLAFYSTLETSIDPLHRDIVLYHAPEWTSQIDNILEHFSKKYPIEILSDQDYQD